jgi:hypothetical protein
MIWALSDGKLGYLGTACSLQDRNKHDARGLPELRRRNDKGTQCGDIKMNSTRKFTKYGYTSIHEFRNADATCSKPVHSDSIECSVLSSGGNTTVTLTKPRSLSRPLGSLESIKERIEKHHWSSISVWKNESGETPTWRLDFSGEEGDDDLFDFSLTCDDYRERSER